MKRSDKLGFLKGLAEKKKKDADQLLMASRARVEDAKAQLAQLQGFVAEYQQRYEEAGRSGASIAQINVYLGFINKLNGAIAQQEKALEMHQHELTVVEAHWAKSLGQSNAIAKRHQSSLNQEAAAEEKALQRTFDERAGYPTRS